MADGLYVYAIARTLDDKDLDVAAIAGRPTRLVEHRGLVAVVSEVDLDEFGEEGLRRNLEDLEWVRTVAFSHDDVVRGVFAQGPAAPMRLATIFLGEDSLRASLEEWHDDVTAVLERIDGRAEWSVKVFIDPQARTGQPTGDRATSGRDYLARRKQEAAEREVASAQDMGTVNRLHEALSEIAVAGRLLPAQDRQLSGHQGEMLLNGAYLVEEGDAADFQRRAHDGAGRMRVVVEGPWPPYSFAVLEQA